LYQLQKAMYDYLSPKRGIDPTRLDPQVLRSSYDLTEEESAALRDADVKALYRLGVHPVLLNSYARARVPRDRYRGALDELVAEEAGRTAELARG
jgi:hypothetical protein